MSPSKRQAVTVYEFHSFFSPSPVVSTATGIYRFVVCFLMKRGSQMAVEDGSDIITPPLIGVTADDTLPDEVTVKLEWNPSADQATPTDR